MMRANQQQVGLKWLSIIVAVLLETIHYSSVLQWCHPFWMLLVVMYWSVQSPHHLGVFRIWLLGLILDVLTGELLGLHGLLLVVLMYLVSIFQMRIRLFPLVQQSAVMLILSYIYALLYVFIHHLMNQPVTSTWFWFAPWLTVLFWALFAQMLQRRSLRMNTL